MVYSNKQRARFHTIRKLRRCLTPRELSANFPRTTPTWRAGYFLFSIAFLPSMLRLFLCTSNRANTNNALNDGEDR